MGHGRLQATCESHITMRQGDIWFADLNPTKGSEQSGKRPVVIVSGDPLDEALPIVIVVPITSKIKSYPTCVRLLASQMSGLRKDSEAVPFQIRAIAKERLTERVGRISTGELRDIIKGLFLALTH